MNVAIGTGLALVAIIGACLFVLWYGSAVLIDQLEDRIEVLERNWAEQFGAPAEDDSPSALEAVSDDTDEFPAIPATEPMPLVVDPTPAVQARRDAAWEEQRPSPIPRDLSDEFPHPVDSDERKAKNAADIDERLKRFNFSGRNR